MAFPFRRILNPVDFDDNSFVAMDVAAELARQNDGTVFVLHVVPLSKSPAGGPAYVELYKDQEKIDREHLKQLADKRLQGVKYEVAVEIGPPADEILKAEKTVVADVAVMATHGRSGVAHMFLGSTAESVLRQSICPVLA